MVPAGGRLQRSCRTSIPIGSSAGLTAPTALRHIQQPPHQATRDAIAPQSSLSRRSLLISTAAGAAAPHRRRAVAAMASSSGSQDLLIVGPGVLGAVAGKMWKEQFPQADVVGQTNSTANHDRLQALGITPRAREDADPQRQYPHVLFSAPPSGSQDYPADVKAAAGLWDGSGSLVFTSSMSVCAQNEGGVVDEDCPLVALGASPKTDVLLRAEQAALEANGNVLRLVGLYHSSRGAHTAFLKMGEVRRYGGYVLNLLHYEDAAALAVAILRGDGSRDPYRRRVFLGSDNVPLSFEQMMAACTAEGSRFAGRKVTFTGPRQEGNLGKQVSNVKTRRQLGGWEPRYTTFADFWRSGGEDFYSSSDLF